MLGRTKIIAITGTKGKTTIALIINKILLENNFKTLCISSEGVIENGNKIRDNEYFLRKYKTSANVAAISRLNEYEFSEFDYLILEASYGASQFFEKSFLNGKIDLAVLSNVYWDHIDGIKIKNRKDLLNKKLGILLALKNRGEALIYNGDKKNNISWKAIIGIKEKRPDIKINLYSERKNKEKTISQFYFEKDKIYLNDQEILNLKETEFASKKSKFVQSSNIVAIAAILKILKIKFDCLVSLKNIEKIIPGRMNIFEKDNFKVILDYAHEIKSLTSSSKFIKKSLKPKKIIAVVRLSYYRTDEYIKDLTQEIAELFGDFIVYDKAISRPNLSKIFSEKYHRKPGDIGKLMANILKRKGKKVIKIDNEIRAIEEGIKNLRKNELLYIMGDQIEKDIGTIKKALKEK